MMEQKLLNGKTETEFLQYYDHAQKSVSEIGLVWDELIAIYEDYQSNRDFLEHIARDLHAQLVALDGAYIVKYRVKDAEHLIDKIIRKKIDSGLVVTKENYIDVFDDLIGLRILHLFKDAWEILHAQITNKYVLNEQAIVYYRKGDSDEFIKHCQDLGMKAKVKEAGYRSIHYVIKKPILGKKLTCEIQVRTVIEDAWSEIDHIVRYPNNTSNDLLNRYLLIFNTLAGSADEMGSYLMLLKKSLVERQTEVLSQKEKYEAVVTELKDEISKLSDVNASQKRKINKLMKELNSNVPVVNASALNPQTFAYMEKLTKSPLSSMIFPSTELLKMQESMAALQHTTDVLKTLAATSSSPGFEMPSLGLSSAEILLGTPKKK